LEKRNNSSAIQIDLRQTHRPNEKIGVLFVQMDISESKSLLAHHALDHS